MHHPQRARAKEHLFLLSVSSGKIEFTWVTLPFPLSSSVFYFSRRMEHFTSLSPCLPVSLSLFPSIAGSVTNPPKGDGKSRKKKLIYTSHSEIHIYIQILKKGDGVEWKMEKKRNQIAKKFSRNDT